MPDNRAKMQLVREPTAAELFPDLRQARTWATFTLVSFSTALTLSIVRSPWHPDFSASVASLSIQVFAIGGAWLIALKYIVSRCSQLNTPAAYPVFTAVLLCISLGVLTLLNATLPEASAKQHMPPLPSLILSVVIGLLALRYFYINASQKLSQQRSQVANHQALSARIRPHFLFNTLNTIAELTRTDPEAAEHAVEGLARLYRRSLADGQHTVSLIDEVHTAKSYLSIEQYRVGNRMQQTWDTEQLPEDAQLPILTLQPLVENAVYHGIELCAEGGNVSIQGELKANVISITIANPVPEAAHSNQQKGNNMAIDNIRQRLALAFGKKATMLTEKADRTYRVTLTFPYVKAGTQR